MIDQVQSINDIDDKDLQENYERGDGVSILTEVSPLDHLFQQKRSLSIGPLTYKHVWKFSNLSKLNQNHRP